MILGIEKPSVDTELHWDWPDVGVFSLETFEVVHPQTELGKETESFCRRLQ